MNKEMNEICEFLEKRNDYVIWAGFAAYAHLGLTTSNDIDIFVKEKKKIEEISKYFLKNKWKITKDEKGIRRFYKKGTTFDICFAKGAEALFFKKKKIKINNYNLNFISKEVLFLTKRNQVTKINRTDSKTKRDRKVIEILKNKVNINDLKKLIQKMPPAFWTTDLFK